MALAGALVLIAALVVEDHASLRAAAQDSAPRQAVLWRGDWVEVRGERAGYVQVYDHRHERPGYVRPWQVRMFPVDETSALALRSVIDFVRDTPGAESLGIGLVALYLKAAPARDINAATFDALGTMADRLASRASSTASGSSTWEAIAAHLEVAASYGVKLASAPAGEGKTRLCYDGEAFRRVLALGGTPLERARAALGLTRPQCENAGQSNESPAPSLSPSAELALAEWRRGVLADVDGAAAAVPTWTANRLRLRRAAVEAQLAFAYARRGEAKHAAAASEAAVRALALVEKSELLAEDVAIYEETAVRVGASRWAAEASPMADRNLNLKARVAIDTVGGQPGETCIRVDGKVVRCTYGIVWLSSLRIASRGDDATLAVQPLAGWLELWVLRKLDGVWQVDTLTPSTTDPDLGYVEHAGWSPDGQHLLVVRESRLPAVDGHDGGVRRDFQVLSTATLSIEKQAHRPDTLLGFRRWQSPDWKSRTLALR